MQNGCQMCYLKRSILLDFILHKFERLYQTETHFLCLSYSSAIRLPHPPIQTLWGLSIKVFLMKLHVRYYWHCNLWMVISAITNGITSSKPRRRFSWVGFAKVITAGFAPIFFRLKRFSNRKTVHGYGSFWALGRKNDFEILSLKTIINKRKLPFMCNAILKILAIAWFIKIP